MTHESLSAGFCLRYTSDKYYIWHYIQIPNGVMFAHLPAAKFSVISLRKFKQPWRFKKAKRYFGEYSPLL